MMNMAVGVGSGAAGNEQIGLLTWWTLAQGEYDLTDVRNSAVRAGVPATIQNRLNGRTRTSAWVAATQLGSSGHPVPSDPGHEDEEWRLVTRDYPDSDPASKSRLLVLEQIRREADTVREMAGAQAVARLQLEGGRYTTHSIDWWVEGALREEVERLIEQMHTRMLRIEGCIDDGRIRATVLAWLEQQHRICVRGTGGVYFIPTPTGRVQGLEQDVLAIRQWLATISSSFSVVALNRAGAHSIEDFVADAVEEIKTELLDIQERLNKWQENDKMNAGSRAFSAGSQVERMGALKVKIDVLKETLGEEIGVVDAMFGLLSKRTKQMRAANERVVVNAKAKRQTAKEQAPQTADSDDKKAGTAATRQRRKQVS